MNSLRHLVELYYQVSPPLARWLGHHANIATVVRKLLLNPIATLVRIVFHILLALLVFTSTSCGNQKEKDDVTSAIVRVGYEALSNATAKTNADSVEFTDSADRGFLQNVTTSSGLTIQYLKLETALIVFPKKSEAWVYAGNRQSLEGDPVFLRLKTMIKHAPEIKDADDSTSVASAKFTW